MNDSPVTSELSPDILAAAYQDLPCPVALCANASGNWRFLHLNEAFEQLPGSESLKLPNQTLSAWLNERLPDQLSEQIRTALLREQAVVEEVTGIGGPKSSSRHRLHITPVRAGKGRVSHHVVLLTALEARSQDPRNACLVPPSPSKPTEEHLCQLVGSIRAIHWEADPVTFQFLYVGPQAEGLLGFPISDWLKLGFWAARVHPEDLDQAIAFCSEQTREGRDHTFEYRMLTADGRVVWILDVVTVVQQGGVQGTLRGLLLDITEQKLAEERLRHSEQKYRTLVETTGTGFCIIDESGQVLDANEEFVRITGRHQLEDVLGHNVVEWTAPHDRERNRQAIAACSVAGQTRAFQLEYLDPNGRTRPIEVNSALVHTPQGKQIHALVTDITERRATEAELQKMACLAQHTSNLVLITNAERQIEWVNEAFTRVTGYTLAEVKGRTPGQLLQGPDSDPNTVAYMKTQLSLQQGFKVEVLNYTRTREPYWVELEVQPIFDSLGKLTSYISIETLITERREALLKEQLLRRQLEASLKQLQMVMEKMPIGCAVLDPQLQVTYWNPACERIFGFTVAEVIGRSLAQTIARPEDPHPIALGLVEAKQLYLHQHKAGQSVLCRWHQTSLVDREGKLLGYLGMVEDVTEQERLKEEIVQGRKMEAVGRLAGGVAHDFNNILTVITGYSQLLLENVPPHHPQHTSLMEILRAGDRATELTRQLLAFSRKQIQQPKIFLLNEVIQKTLRMLGRLLGEDIVLELRLHSRQSAIFADAGHIEQILINLAVNARDAMPQGGTLIIETRDTEWATPFLWRMEKLPPGLYVTLSVTDTGLGMTAEVRQHIFEPFFTTKGVGKGTGLGLATVYGIVKQNSGAIEVDSELGRGTKFTIHFPRAIETLGSTESATTDESFGGRETLLLVEDDLAVRRLLADMLTEQGYVVWQAADGVEALQVAQHKAPVLDLLITDVVMPRMGGRELREKLHATRPNLPTLFMSGYTEDELLRRGISDGSVAFLQKPFSPEMLLRKIRDTLNSHASS